MLKIKSTFILVGVFFLVPELFGQDATENSEQTAKNTEFIQLLNQKNDGFLWSFDLSSKEVIGTPFLYDDWKDGIIFMYDKKEFIGLKLKFDIYNNELLYLNTNDHKTYSINKNAIQKFIIKDGSVEEIYTKYFLKGISGISPEMNFVKLLFAGDSKLIKLSKKNLVKGKEVQAYSSSSNDKFVYQEFYLILKKNGELIKIKQNKNSIIKVFPEKESEINTFLKKNPLDLKIEENLIKILEFIEQH